MWREKVLTIYSYMEEELTYICIQSITKNVYCVFICVCMCMYIHEYLVCPNMFIT